MKQSGEKEAWLHIVRPAELDTHMAAVGQAEANARLLQELLARVPAKRGERLLVHGCGTCQMFDYIDPSVLGPLQVTFADVSGEMLEATRTRLDRMTGLVYELVLDDIERSALRGTFDIIVLALVLLHVDWRRSISNMLSLGPRWVVVIEQEQAAGTPIVSPARVVPRSIKKFAEVAQPRLIQREELIGAMKDGGYDVAELRTSPVPDDKTMVGLLFERLPSLQKAETRRRKI